MFITALIHVWPEGLQFIHENIGIIRFKSLMKSEFVKCNHYNQTQINWKSDLHAFQYTAQAMFFLSKCGYKNNCVTVSLSNLTSCWLPYSSFWKVA